MVHCGFSGSGVPQLGGETLIPSTDCYCSLSSSSRSRGGEEEIDPFAPSGDKMKCAWTKSRKIYSVVFRWRRKIKIAQNPERGGRRERGET